MKLLFLTTFLVLVATRAFADLEINGHYAFHNVSPSTLNSVDQALYGANFPGHSQVPGYGGTAAYYAPIKFGVGVRYENYSDNVTGNNQTSAITATRVAALLGYRLIDTSIYLGLLGTYGFSHTMNLSMSGLSNVNTTSQSSYSIGAEGGFKFGRLKVGVEIGYLYFLGKELQANGGDVIYNGGQVNVDLSGLYTSIDLGVYF
jgi:hypothetical protein